MSSVTRLYLAAVLLVVFLAATQAKRSAPFDICALHCVQRIYKNHCGGAICVYGYSNDEQRQALCSDECINALEGKPMRSCLKRRFLANRDFDALVAREVQQVKDHCATFDDYHAEAPIEPVDVNVDDEAVVPLEPVDVYVDYDAEDPIEPVGADEDHHADSPVELVDADEDHNAEGSIEAVDADEVHDTDDLGEFDFDDRV